MSENEKIFLLSDNAFKVYHYINYLEKEKRMYKPSHFYLSDKLNKSQTTIFRALREIKDLGLYKEAL